MTTQTKQKSEVEFIIIMAGLMSLVALSIDAILPALAPIGEAIQIKDPKDNQLLITMIFLGLGFGQLIAGPLSDSFGRKPVIYVGFGIFTLASILCVVSTSLELMVLGRIIQGIGLSAPRTVSLAMVRDRFSGDHMAKIMSFVTVIFILVPVVAPTFGKLMLDHFGWASIFNSQLLFGGMVLIWLWKRQPETLVEANRKALKRSLFFEGAKTFFSHKTAVIYTVISGLITAAFLGYLSASQHIFQSQYQLVDEFPYIFAGLALGIGLATFLNGHLVIRFGMRKLASTFIIAFTIIPLVYIILYWGAPNPSSTVLIGFLGLILFSVGFVFGNINALAMQPIGHIAGIGAAIIGFISTLMAVPISTFIGRNINDTVLPLFIGFFLCGGLSLILIQLAKILSKKK